MLPSAGTWKPAHFAGRNTWHISSSASRCGGTPPITGRRSGSPTGSRPHCRANIPAPPAAEPSATRFRGSWLGNRWAGSFASFLLAAVLSSGVTYYLIAPDQQNTLAQEVVGAHVRSLMADHLTDVTSTDQHTVKPWFNGRVDVAPPVGDLEAEGYPLVGGRLDYLDDRPVAALIYRHDRHLINLFMWPAAGEIAAPTMLVRQGYNLVHWQHSGSAFWVISDLNADALSRFVLLVRREEPKSGDS